MPSPKKRKARKMIGRTLAKGAGMTLAAAVADDLENVLNIGLYGHDSSGGFTQGGALTVKTAPNQSIPKNDGLETVSEVNARATTTDWHLTAKHHYFSDDTTLLGLTAANPATATEGIVYSPEGPGAKMIPSLEDVSEGSAIKFWVKPTGWTGGQNIRWGTEMNCGDASDTIKVYQGDNDALITTITPDSSGDSAADVKGTIAHDTTPNGDFGVYFVFERDSSTATAQGGFQIWWETT